ncbi:unnamed protein product, partial [Didymodactylos carnosus]
TELAKQKKEPIRYEHGKAVADKIEAHYLECSARTKENIREVFVTD